ncbi:hypothetical protein [Actinomadura opuntiae]|uniref:hypothetical protein n=1 Tax=Actinomadura sp. OS1-43 TaxID=604315 RepID=UPI00255AD673|nr:hypothetical protein [Actinomadura sp. OS1-43]MDL4812739.1 hypothetical protein [Actinomadura sp. OS1-43]
MSTRRAGRARTRPARLTHRGKVITINRPMRMWLGEAFNAPRGVHEQIGRREGTPKRKNRSGGRRRQQRRGKRQ